MRASEVADAVVRSLDEWQVPERYLLPGSDGSVVPPDRRLRHILWISPGDEGDVMRHLTYIVELGDTRFQQGRPRGAENATTVCNVTISVSMPLVSTPDAQRKRWMMARDVAEDVARHLTLTPEQVRGMTWVCSMIEDLGVDAHQTTYAVRLVGAATHQTPT